jgi:addiction module HigA family antidote
VKRTANKLPPIHPGEILREEFMLPRGLSQNALARALNVPPRRINEIVLEMGSRFSAHPVGCNKK